MYFGRNYFGQELNASVARKNASEAKLEVELLRHELERILMINQALWEIVQETNNLDKDYLFKKVIEIDGRDGKVDGKVSKTPPKHCAKCNQVLPKDKPFCFYCGNKTTNDLFAR